MENYPLFIIVGFFILMLIGSIIFAVFSNFSNGRRDDSPDPWDDLI